MECGQGHMTLLIFWSLNDNSSKMAKDTNFKFGMHGKQEGRAVAKMTMRCALGPVGLWIAYPENFGNRCMLYAPRLL